MRVRLLLGLATCVGALPFAFGVIRAVQTGTDVRYLWVAAAALLGAAVTIRLAPRYAAKAPAALACFAFVVAALSATGAARLLGTRVNPGMMIVAASFGFCGAAACWLVLLARRRRDFTAASR